MRIKTENIEESLEPLDVDKGGSEASEEGTHGLNKMFPLLGYSKIGVYRSVHISKRGFVSTQYKCTKFLNPVTLGMDRKKLHRAKYIYSVQLCDGSKEMCAHLTTKS